MNKKNPPLLVSSELLLGSLQAAKELGIELEETLNKYNINPIHLSTPEGFLEFHQVAEFLETVASQNACMHFGFLVGKHQPPMQFGLLTKLFTLSPNVKSALENSLKYLVLYSEEVIWDLMAEGDYVSIIRQDRAPYNGSLVQLHTLGITQCFDILKTLCGNNWQPTHISFSHSAPAEYKQYERYFQCPVYFDQPLNGITFPSHCLQQTIETSDPQLLPIVQEHLNSLREKCNFDENIATKVRTLIQQRLATNTCNIESIAQLLGHHPRTLQRELKKHDVTFKRILSDVRKETAEHYLRNSNITLIDLSDLLGYRNVSAFSLAFKKRTGIAPDYWRRANTQREKQD